MVYGSLLVLAALPLWRYAYVSLIVALPARRLLFLGCSDSIPEILSALKIRPLLTPIGYLSSGAQDLPMLPRLGSLEEAAEVIHRHKPDRIVAALPALRHARPLLDLYLNGAQVEELTDLYESVTGRVSIRDLQPDQLIFTHEFDPIPLRATFHDLYSWLLALVALVVTLPVMAVAALALKCSCSGPVFRRQQHVGAGGARFDRYTFQTTLPSSSQTNPKTSRAGRSIRALHLEGLPQLFNILLGDMSFIGPQPVKPAFAAVLDEHIPFYRQRLTIRPGILGWERINMGDQPADALQALAYDLYYVKNMSFALDCYIFVHSFSPPQAVQEAGVLEARLQ